MAKIGTMKVKKRQMNTPKRNTYRIFKIMINLEMYKPIEGHSKGHEAMKKRSMADKCSHLVIAHCRMGQRPFWII
jgi:hypothetical protein